jgi:glycosyltransferase involved in cell wall biosynthesis
MMRSLKSRRVYLLTPNLVPHDAIGNDVVGMAQSLRRSGYEVEVYAEGIHPALAGTAEKLDMSTHSFWRDREALLIYHHSTGWVNGQAILTDARCCVAIKYHNVTPPRFFEPYSSEYVVSCEAGQLATETVALTPNALFWGDSKFNSEDLIEGGADPNRCRVLAPFHCLNRLAESPLSPEVIQSCRQHRGPKLLFVGGLKPNKGHARLIQVLAAYNSYADPDAVLLLPGSCDPRLANYAAALRQFAAQLGVESKVLFVGPVDDSQLRSYYFCADVFLCLSEHEGFCVPLLEAMHFRTPIVAHNSTAIPETVGDAGLLWEEDELACIVESIAVCAERDDRSRALAAAGFQRYSDYYSPQRIEQHFLSLVEEAFQA